MPAPQIVIYRTDSALDDELDTALSSASQISPVTHYFDDVRDAIEAARDYRPRIVIAEMTDDIRALGVLADEVSACSPGTSIVAVFRPDQLQADVSESTILIQALRLGVEDFIRRPISSRDLEQLLSRRLQVQREREDPTGVTIAFVSNKGGVGKSTMSVNVAVALAKRHPDRVLLIDGSLQMGVCAAQLDLESPTTIVDAWHERDRLDSRLLRELTVRHASGLDLLAAPVAAVDAIDVDDAIMSRILMLARRTYDYVIVDTFPLLDRVVMAILDLSDLAYVVMENVVPTMRSIRGFLELLADVEFPEDRQRLVLNRFTKMGGSPKHRDVESFLGRDINHVIPFDRKFIQAVNTGRPLTLGSSAFSSSVRSVHNMVDEIESHAAQVASGRDVSQRNGQLVQPTVDSPSVSELDDEGER